MSVGNSKTNALTLSILSRLSSIQRLKIYTLVKKEREMGALYSQLTNIIHTWEFACQGLTIRCTMAMVYQLPEVRYPTGSADTSPRHDNDMSEAHPAQSCSYILHL